jgi:hypothetical protein
MGQEIVSRSVSSLDTVSVVLTACTWAQAGRLGTQLLPSAVLVNSMSMQAASGQQNAPGFPCWSDILPGADDMHLQPQMMDMCVSMQSGTESHAHLCAHKLDELLFAAAPLLQGSELCLHLLQHIRQTRRPRHLQKQSNVGGNTAAAAAVAAVVSAAAVAGVVAGDAGVEPC